MYHASNCIYAVTTLIKFPASCTLDQPIRGLKKPSAFSLRWWRQILMWCFLAPRNCVRNGCQSEASHIRCYFSKRTHCLKSRKKYNSSSGFVCLVLFFSIWVVDYKAFCLPVYWTQEVWPRFRYNDPFLTLLHFDLRILSFQRYSVCLTQRSTQEFLSITLTDCLSFCLIHAF